MRKYHIVSLISLMLAASNVYAADAVDAVPVPPEVKTTQIQRSIPCTLQALKKVDGNCKIDLTLEEFNDLKNLTVIITTPTVPVVEAAPVVGVVPAPLAAVPVAPVAAVPASAVIVRAPESVFSATLIPITAANIRLYCGYEQSLAESIIKYHQVFTPSERRLIGLYWDWEWYGWACSNMFEGRKRFAVYP